MRTKLTLSLTGAAIFGLILAGCSTATTAPAAAPVAGTDIAVATTGLGKIVVDGKGMTAYFYDLDKANSGFSACTGQCAAIWPALTSTTATPTVTGVSGTVGIIGGTAGDTQATLNGRPLYTYSGDSSAGKTNGQGIDGIWYVVSPTGEEMKSAKPTKPGKAGY